MKLHSRQFDQKLVVETPKNPFVIGNNLQKTANSLFYAASHLNKFNCLSMRTYSRVLLIGYSKYNLFFGQCTE
jgi:hypothetical protein